MKMLKPCPFCGGKKLTFIEERTGPIAYQFSIRCDQCKSAAQGHLYMDAESATNSAIKCWNERAEDGDEQGAVRPAQAPRWLIVVCAVIFAALIVSGIVWRFYAK